MSQQVPSFRRDSRERRVPSDSFSFCSRGGKLFLLQKLVSVGCVAGAYGIHHRGYRLHINQGPV